MIFLVRIILPALNSVYLSFGFWFDEENEFELMLTKIKNTNEYVEISFCHDNDFLNLIGEWIKITSKNLFAKAIKVLTHFT